MSEEDSLEDDPLWYKDAIIYELHVKAFYDSAGDGIGDFRGLTSKLDYLKDLGITAVWLLPFYPSPLKDDGYDISDYLDVHRLYGVLKDFKEFLREAHNRGIRVITELVLNHTSDQHPWFIQSRNSEAGTPMRDFYVWNSSQDKYKEARIIFKDFESSNWAYDPLAKAYYWHRFYSYQPDLNYDNPEVQKAMLDVVRFWMKMGVDGMRIDAVPYLFEREGTNCENLPETHDFLKKLRKTIDSEFKNRMLLAEANQWPKDAAAYFGNNGDECNMEYHFPLMPRMFMAIQMEDSFPIIDILEETPKPPDNCQHALFLRNHDELTLEMVTDEERDYMYRVYARDKQARINLGIRRRLAPLLGDDRRKIELMNVMLFTLPGTPVIYYGDEIGMGDNFYLGDRNGVRTPMQWSADLNAGFSRTNPQKLYLPVIIEPLYHYEAINVENQQNDPTSLMWWMKKMISIRKRYKTFGRGSIQFIFCENTKILCFTREYKNELILVMLNLSKNPQSAEIDLSKYRGHSLQDVFGGIPFPSVDEKRYRMTFGPYGYYVFALRPQTIPPENRQDVPEIHLKRRAQDLFIGNPRERLETEILPAYLKTCRWFGGKGRVLDRVKVRDIREIPDPLSQTEARFTLLVVDVSYAEGLPEAYVIPIEYLPIEKAMGIVETKRNSPITKVNLEKGERGVIFDAVYDSEFWKTMLRIISSRQPPKENQPEITGEPREALAKITDSNFLNTSQVHLLDSEQSNSSALFEDQLVLKLLRKVEEGTNPEVEIGDVLAKHGFTSTPQFLGDLKYSVPESESATIGILQAYVRNQGDGWKLFTSEFHSFIERALTQPANPSGSGPSGKKKSIIDLAFEEVSEQMNHLLTPFFIDKVRLLGLRTAEFHKTLFEEKANPDFAPEPFGYLKQVGISQSMISYANRVFKIIAKSTNHVPSNAKDEIESLVFNQDVVTRRFTAMRNQKIDAVVMRTHGDYHLGQVLYTGKDYSIIDYEGEPSRSLSDRRLKRSPLRDVAGMIRSFHYAAYSAILTSTLVKDASLASREELWADEWYKYVSAVFLRSYLDSIGTLPIVPKDRPALCVLFDAYLLEKVVYELWYEFNNRPDWIMIPLKGIKDILGQEYHSTSSYPKKIDA